MKTKKKNEEARTHECEYSYINNYSLFAMRLRFYLVAESAEENPMPAILRALSSLLSRTQWHCNLTNYRLRGPRNLGGAMGLCHVACITGLDMLLQSLVPVTSLCSSSAARFRKPQPINRNPNMIRSDAFSSTTRFWNSVFLNNTFLCI